MWVDKGREFYNKDVQKLVELFSTEKEEKSCLIERFNKTIKEKMFTYFSANNARKFVDVLGLLVHQYNHAIHSSIKTTPKEASRKKNENNLWRNLYPELGGKTLRQNFQLVIVLE